MKFKAIILEGADCCGKTSFAKELYSREKNAVLVHFPRLNTLDSVESAIKNLIEICEQLLFIDKDIKEIFGYPDYLKVQSCITLFEIVAKEETVFKKIIDKFYKGERDKITIQRLEENQ